MRGSTSSAAWYLAVLVAGICAGAASAFSSILLAGIVGVAALVCLLLLLRRGMASRAMAASTPDNSVAVELVLLPLAVSVRSVPLAVVGIAAVFLAVVRRIREKTEWRRGSREGWMPVVLLLVAFFVTVRELNAVAVLAVLGSIAVILLVIAKLGTEVAARSLIRGASFYLIANAVGHFLGLESPGAALRTGALETSSSLFDERILFPFARSLNEPAIVAAALAAVVFAQTIERRRVHYVEWLGVVAGAFIVVAADTRFAPLVGLSVCVVLVVARKLLIAVALPLAVLSLLLPIYVGLLGSVIDSTTALIADVPALSRSQSAADLSSLGTRRIIWEKSTDYWLDQVPLGRKIIGYGKQGHAVSQAYLYYGDKHSGFLRDPTSLTPHNSFLQQLYDGGVIGVAAFLGALGVMFARMRRRAAHLALLVMALVLCIGGALESVLAPAFAGTPVILLFGLAAIVSRPPSESSEADSADWDGPAVQAAAGERPA